MDTPGLPAPSFFVAPYHRFEVGIAYEIASIDDLNAGRAVQSTHLALTAGSELMTFIKLCCDAFTFINGVTAMMYRKVEVAI
jgi:hypothetical protein